MPYAIDPYIVHPYLKSPVRLAGVMQPCGGGERTPERTVQAIGGYAGFDSFADMIRMFIERDWFAGQCSEIPLGRRAGGVGYAVALGGCLTEGLTDGLPAPTDAGFK